MRHAKVALCVAALVAITSGSARADLFDFSYTVFGGINASGTLTATLQSGNTYLITGITGTRNGNSILSLISPGSYGLNDNLLYFPAGGDSPEGNTYIDTNGFAYTTIDGNFQPWGCGITSCAEDPPEYDEEHGTPNPTGSTIITSFSISRQASAPAPIPGAGALSYMLVMFGAALGWRKQLTAHLMSLRWRLADAAQIVAWRIRRTAA